MPRQENFYSSLAGKKIRDKDYERAVTIWNAFEMEKMKDCQDLYLKLDVLLLADVFEKFRNNSLINCGCPIHYFSAATLSWDAMPNIKKVEIEIIADADIYLFFEKGMRGRFLYISKRYSQANNKYLKFYGSK